MRQRVLYRSSFEHFSHYRTILPDCLGVAGYYTNEGCPADFITSSRSKKLVYFYFFVDISVLIASKTVL